MKQLSRVVSLLFILIFIITACAPKSIGTIQTPNTASPGVTEIPAPIAPTPSGLWIGESVPAVLRDRAVSWNIPLKASPQNTAVRLDISSSLTADPKFSESKLSWIYALVAPFPTVIDGVTSEQLRAAWSGGEAPTPFNGHPLLMDESTLAAFTALWGVPDLGSVRSVPSAQLLDAAWSETPSWAIVPFESIEPRWKVLTIDGQSPIRKGFDPSIYPLAISFTL